MLSSIVSVVHFSPLSPLLYSKLRLPCAESAAFRKKNKTEERQMDRI